MPGPYRARFWKIFLVCLRCARMVPIVDVLLVVTAWIAVSIPRDGVACLVQVFGTMATGGVRGARVPEWHVPSTRETLVPII